MSDLTDFQRWCISQNCNTGYVDCTECHNCHIIWLESKIKELKAENKEFEGWKIEANEMQKIVSYYVKKFLFDYRGIEICRVTSSKK